MVDGATPAARSAARLGAPPGPSCQPRAHSCRARWYGCERSALPAGSVVQRVVAEQTLRPARHSRAALLQQMSWLKPVAVDALTALLCASRRQCGSCEPAFDHNRSTLAVKAQQCCLLRCRYCLTVWPQGDFVYKLVQWLWQQQSTSLSALRFMLPDRRLTCQAEGCHPPGLSGRRRGVGQSSAEHLPLHVQINLRISTLKEGMSSLKSQTQLANNQRPQSQVAWIVHKC